MSARAKQDFCVELGRVGARGGGGEGWDKGRRSGVWSSTKLLKPLRSAVKKSDMVV